MAVSSLTVAVRLVQFASVLGMFGTATLGIYAPAAFALVRPRGALTVAAVAGIVAAALSVSVVSAQMSGVTASMFDLNTLLTVATGTLFGVAALARISALVVALVLMLRLAPPHRAPVVAVTGMSGVAAATLAWSGHAAGSEGLLGAFRLAADILHLLAAGIWLGALLVFLRLIGRQHPDATDHVHVTFTRFAGVGAGVVVVLFVTGAINAGMAVGWIQLTRIAAKAWVLLLMLKLALFVAMLGLAAFNRFRLTPALAVAHLATLRAKSSRLRVSLLLETTAGLLIFALVALLGTLAPIPDV